MDMKIHYSRMKDQFLTLNDLLEKSEKTMNDNLQESLKWCKSIGETLKNELEKEKNAQKKRGTNTMRARVTRQTKNNILLSQITIKTTGINNIDDSISMRTRGALRTIRASEMVVTNGVTCNDSDLSRTLRSRRQKDSGNKRNAEDDIQSSDALKKSKQKNVSVIQAQENDENFKKPQSRTRGRTRKQKQTVANIVNEMLVEDSQFFISSALAHSSPKTIVSSTECKTFVLTPESTRPVSNSPKPSSQNVDLKTVKVEPTSFSSISSDSVRNFKDAMANPITEVLSSTARDSRLKRNRSKNHIPSNEESQDVTMTAKGTVGSIDSAEPKKGSALELSRVSPPSSNLPTAEALANEESLNGVDGSSLVIENSPKSTAVSRISSRKRSNSGSLNMEKESKSHASTPETVNLCSTPSNANETITRQTRSKVREVSPSPIQAPKEFTGQGWELNLTKEMPVATKRTKPVIKSKVLDDKGNPIRTKARTTSPEGEEKKYELRSSSQSAVTSSGPKEPFREIKKEELNGNVDTVDEAVSSSTRRSNQENDDPRKKRPKRTKAQKPGTSTSTSTESVDTGRVTRTKTKQSIEEAERKSRMSTLARKSLKKAKLNLLHQDKMKQLQTLSSRVTCQKAENENALKMLSSTKKDAYERFAKLRSPLVTSSVAHIGSHVKQPSYLKNVIMSNGKGKNIILYESREKANMYTTPAKIDQLSDKIKSAAKTRNKDDIEKELKLRALKEKEEEAVIKREMAIKNRQNELKKKNEMKLMSAMKQREKLEQEKYNNAKQSEMEKEAKRKMLLKEREMKLKEKALQKKILNEQKLAETEERRRLDEEARLAKLKEQEAEQQRLMLEKQKELERHEKRAQERLADEKAREKYEMKMKEEMMKEKMAKLQSASKGVKQNCPRVAQTNYSSRNENDYGLEDENSKLESDDEEQPAASKKPIPLWAKRVKSGKAPSTQSISLEMVNEYMPCYQKSPDVERMFRMTPTKRIKRTSSAIWNTPSS